MDNEERRWKARLSDPAIRAPEGVGWVEPGAVLLSWKLAFKGLRMPVLVACILKGMHGRHFHSPAATLIFVQTKKTFV